MFLTPAEIAELTGKKRKPAQIRALRYMGIEHKIRPDGAVIVSRAHIEKLLDGIPPNSPMYGDHPEPNWSALTNA